MVGGGYGPASVKGVLGQSETINPDIAPNGKPAALFCQNIKRTMMIKEINPDVHYIEDYRRRINEGDIAIDGVWRPFNRDWFLSPEGDMNHVSDYPIERSQLDDEDWLLHLMEKSWFDANTFLPAYFEACRRAGLPRITIQTEY